MVLNSPPPVPWLNAAAVIAASLSAIFSMVSSIASLKQLRINSEHASSQHRSARAHIFLEIADRWSKVLEVRRILLAKKNFFTFEQLRDEYEQNKTEVKTYKDFLCSNVWLNELRPICNFYETLGVMLEQGSIAPSAMFVLVTVDNLEKIQESDRDGNITVREEFAVHRRLKGAIKYLRTYYRQDIYEYYDRYLLEAYRQYLTNSSSQKRDLAREARQLIDREMPVDKSRGF